MQLTGERVRELSRSRGPVRPVLRLLRPRDGAGRRAPVVVAPMVPRCVGSAGGGPHLRNRPGSSPPLVVCPRPFVPEWPHGESQTWPFVPEWPLGESQTRPFVSELPHVRCGLANALTCSSGGRTPRT